MNVFWCVVFCLINSVIGITNNKKTLNTVTEITNYQKVDMDEILLNSSSPALADPEGFILYEVDKETDSKFICLFTGTCEWTTPAPAPASNGHAHNNYITPVYQWSRLEFDYPSEAARQSAIISGDFAEGAIAPIDFDVYYSANGPPKVFITIPRFQAGVPATFGTVTQRTYNGNPVIAPYPSWGWHQNSAQCPRDRLLSVFRIKIDECGRLWVLDAGRILNSFLCSPQILAFNVHTGELLYRYEIPAEQIESRSLLTNLVVDVRDPHAQCRNTFIYVADTQGFALIVHDVLRRTSWRVIDKTMYPNPDFGTYRIKGQEFDIMDGILGMDLSPYIRGKDRVLFYHAMSSGAENWVYTSYLRNQSLFLTNPNYDPNVFHTYRGRRHTQAAGMAIDKDAIAYFGLASDISINCWNTASDYNLNNIGVLVQDDKTLQFASGVKVIDSIRGDQELWFLTMRFQKVATGTLNPNEINFRIQAGYIEDLTQGSKCQNGVPGWQALKKQTLEENN